MAITGTVMVTPGQVFTVTVTAVNVGTVALEQGDVSLVAPPALYPKLLQAKQASDLHTPGFNQRIVYEVIKDGFLLRHVPTVRALYKAQRDAMQAALLAHLPAGCRWQPPIGGMFFWVELPAHLDATALLPLAVTSAHAQAWPQKPIKIIVTFAPVSYTHLTLPTSDLV